MPVEIAVVIPVAEEHVGIADQAARSAHRAGADAIYLVGDRCQPPDLRLPSVVAIQSPSTGRSAARNHGARLARHAGVEWLFWLDADDLMYQTAMDDMRTIVEDDPAVGLVYADGIYSAGTVDGGAWDRAELGRACVINIGMAMRTERFLAIGGFTESMEIGEDYDLVRRYTADPSIKVMKHPRPLICIRREYSTNKLRDGVWRENKDLLYQQGVRA